MAANNVIPNERMQTRPLGRTFGTNGGNTMSDAKND
jgi:hypothetical protein